MKFYIASRLGNFAQVQALSEKLKVAGWVHTYDWTTHGSVKESDVDQLKEVAWNEYNGVKDADVIVVLLPGGKGTHAELGMAIAFGKKVYLCHINDTYFKCDNNTCAFYWLPQVKQFVGGIDDVVGELLGE